MNRTFLDLWVGFFVALGIAAVIFLALKVGNLTGASIENPYTLLAEFENIGGLKVRGAIKSSGVVVGRITNIGFDSKSYQAVVTMTIDGRYKFPKDTFASINTSGLLGEQYISLEAGGDDRMLANKDVILKTQSAVVLEKLISQFLFSKASDGGKTTGAASSSGK